MVPKCESAEEILRIDGLMTVLEKNRGFPEGKIRLDLIVETAMGWLMWRLSVEKAAAFEAAGD